MNDSRLLITVGLVLSSVLAATGAAEAADKSLSFTPQQSGYVVSNAKVRVGFNAPIAPQPGARNVRIQALVTLLGADVEGYQYGGTVYRSVSEIGEGYTGIYDSDLQKMSFPTLRVSGQITYKGKVLGEFDSELLSTMSNPVWSGEVSTDATRSDFRIENLRIVSSKLERLDSKIARALQE